MASVNEDDFYLELRKLGYHYSGLFRALQTMTRKFSYGRGHINKPQHSKMHMSEQQLLVHPGFLDAAFQAIFLAYSWPGDGRLYSLYVPVSIRQIRVDATLCRSNDDSTLTSDSVLAADGSSSNSAGIVGDVDIFSADGSQGMIQVEGIHVVPFAAATAAQDMQMFFGSVSGVAFPDGELAVSGNAAPDEEIAMGWILERIFYFYLRRLVEEISSEEEGQAAWHHQKLMAYARHIVEMVQNDHQPYGKKKCKHRYAAAADARAR
jgi:hybrid polyketide synthase/nonribosomal peptide synthetase ACE1